MSITEVNCLLYFLHILRKNSLLIITIHVINMIFIPILFRLNLVKGSLNIKDVNSGIIYLMMLKAKIMSFF